MRPLFAAALLLPWSAAAGLVFDPLAACQLHSNEPECRRACHAQRGQAAQEAEPSCHRNPDMAESRPQRMTSDLCTCSDAPLRGVVEPSYLPPVQTALPQPERIWARSCGGSALPPASAHSPPVPPP